MSPAQPPPRVWQFSIRSILLLTLLVAAFFAGKVLSDKKLTKALEAEKEARKRAGILVQAEQKRGIEAVVTAAETMIDALEVRDRRVRATDETLVELLEAEILEEHKKHQAREQAAAALREANRARSKSP